MKIEQTTRVFALSSYFNREEYLNDLISTMAKDGWLLVNIFSTSAGEVFLFQRMVN